jgi:uncharacterized protein YfaS (alpha-2-macroglobulin family)
LNSGRWLSTQETAVALLSISEFMESASVSKTVHAKVTLNGETKTVISKHQLYKETLRGDQLSAKTVQVKNESNGILYVNTSEEGKPLESTIEDKNNILSMEISYRDKNGNAVDPGNLTQNQDLIVRVEVKNNGVRGDVKDLALTTIFPSGWEIQNARTDAVASFFETDTPDYQDVRDDRVLTYFDIKSGGTKTFSFLINASYAGEYTLPAITCEAMYDNAIYAYKKGGISVIKK